MADIAGREPPVAKHPRGLFGIAPIALHHVLAADHDLAVFRDAHLTALHWWTDGLEPDSDLGTIAADKRRRLRLAVTLQERDSQRLKENPDLGIERSPARDPGLLAPSKAPTDLASQCEREDA